MEMDTCEYTLIREIGRGAYATVYQVRDKKGHLFALKDVPLASQNNKEKEGISNLNEIDIMSRIKHPTLMTVDRLLLPGESDCPIQGVGLVQPIASGSLLNLLTSGAIAMRISLQQRIVMMFQMALALSVLHSQGILHLDVKLENILYQGNPLTPHLRLADFGLSQYVDNVEVGRNFPHQFVTITYRPPELLRQNGPYHYDGKTDVWSLGIVFLEILNNAQTIFPVDPMTQVNERQKILTDQLCLFSSSSPYLSGISSDPNVIDLLRHVLDLNPQTRYNISQVLGHKLFQGFSLPPALIINPEMRAPPATFNSTLIGQVALEFISWIYAYYPDRRVETLFLTIDLFYRSVLWIELRPPPCTPEEDIFNHANLWNLALTSFLIANNLIEDISTIDWVLVNNTEDGITVETILNCEIALVRIFNGILYRTYLYHRIPNRTGLESAFLLLIDPKQYYQVDIPTWLRTQSDQRPGNKDILLRDYIPNVVQ